MYQAFSARLRSTWAQSDLPNAGIPIRIRYGRALLPCTSAVTEPGSDYHTRRIDLERRMRNHIAQLTAMGYRVTLEPAA